MYLAVDDFGAGYNHLAYLSEAGCDEAQGYWFARPLEADLFTTCYVGRIVAQAQQLALNMAAMPADTNKAVPALPQACQRHHKAAEERPPG